MGKTRDIAQLAHNVQKLLDNDQFRVFDFARLVNYGPIGVDISANTTIDIEYDSIEFDPSGLIKGSNYQNIELARGTYFFFARQSVERFDASVQGEHLRLLGIQFYGADSDYIVDGVGDSGSPGGLKISGFTKVTNNIPTVSVTFENATSNTAYLYDLDQDMHLDIVRISKEQLF